MHIQTRGEYLDGGNSLIKLLLGAVHELARPLVPCSVAQEVQGGEPSLAPGADKDQHRLDGRVRLYVREQVKTALQGYSDLCYMPQHGRHVSSQRHCAGVPRDDDLPQQVHATHVPRYRAR